MIRTSMKLIGNRNNPNSLNGVMEWSNKMDLIALASETGEVTVNRFKWDLPIKIPAPSASEEKLEVRSIAWRMDEKILGIAYSNGQVTLIDVESKDEIHSLNVDDSDIASICWTQNIIDIDEQEKELMKTFKTYLAPLPHLNMSSGNKKVSYNAEKFYSEDALNFLLVATTNAKIHIYIYGVLNCGFIDVAKDLNIEESNVKLLDMKLSRSLKELFVIYKIKNEIKILVYENKTLLKYNLSLWKLSVKYGMILNILGYIEDTIQHIIEAWEVVLLEMDKKLTKYAKKQLPGTVSADFLELLMFGYPSEALDNFLTHDLTERELKKLGNSIELSYSTIQKLVVKPLHCATVALFYHINEVYGMHQNVFYYKDLLGDPTRDAMMNVGAFLIKCYELQQTIDKSMRDYKIFFRWLFIAIARLLNETVPDDIGTITQQEINYLADFLNNFEQNRQEILDDAGEMEIKFNLERVGQYLADKNLVIPMKDDLGFWEDILDENACLKKHDMIFPHHKPLSLIQQKNLMKSSIEEVFGRLKNSIGRDFKIIDDENLTVSPIVSEIACPRSSHTSDVINDQIVNYFSILTSPESLQLIVCFENSTMRTFELKFLSSDESIIPKIGKLSFTDARFYNSKLISLLLKNQIDSRSQSCFMQLAINRIIDDSIGGGCAIVDLYKLIDDTNFKSLEGFNGHAIAVSGSRKVSAILSANFKIIRLYDMEVEDDDGDEELESSSFIE